jgi:ubiquinone/menaquinone biosynthesis C-methylase UbiE
MRSDKYIPALRYDILTPFYDMVVGLTTREKLFKQALVEQAKIRVNQRVLDLACGTGTLAVLLKRDAPQAEIMGIDGDPKILALAKEKARAGNFDVQLDEGMSFALPYADESFDRVISSLFFHHLTRENKLKTLREVWRVLKRGGEMHIADWGLPDNLLMSFLSRLIQILDGFETTSDSFGGLLPELIGDAGFETIEETGYYNTLYGTIRLQRSRKP